MTYSLKSIVKGLKSADYHNEVGPLTEDPAFEQLEQLVAAGSDNPTPADEDTDLSEPMLPLEPFHIEADVYDSGDYLNLLVIPSAESFIIVGNNEHIATLNKSCDDPACWEQQEGSLDDDVMEKLGAAIDSYLQSF